MDLLYDHVLSIADPATGRVALTGAQAGEIIDSTSQCGRTYLAAMCNAGKLVRISEIKSGTPTLYRLPAMCKGDVLTYYEEANKKKAAAAEMEITANPVSAQIQEFNKRRSDVLLTAGEESEVAASVDGYSVTLGKSDSSGDELCDRLFGISRTISHKHTYSITLNIVETGCK